MGAASLRSSFYSPSGLVPFSAWVLVVTVLVPLAVLGGILYTAAMLFVPLVKFRWVGSVGLGWVLGMLAARICRWGKVRSGMFAVLAAAVGFLVAYYAAWGAHGALAEMRRGVPWGPAFASSFLPGEIADRMVKLVRGGGVAGVAGLPLVGIWLIELGSIAYFTRATFLAAWGNRPFCERCDCWNGEPEVLINLPVSPTDPAWQRVAEVGPDAVRKLQLKEDASETVELSVSACPQCDRSYYLSAAAAGWETVENGEPGRKENLILQHLAVTPHQIEQIKELGEMLEEAYRELSDEPAEVLPQGTDPELETGRI